MRIGRNVQIGPNCTLITITHALDAGQRNAGVMQARPVTIGDNVWLASNVTVLPGVEIGSGSIMEPAASSRATSLPESSLAAIPAGFSGPLRMPTVWPWGRSRSFGAGIDKIVRRPFWRSKSRRCSAGRSKRCSNSKTRIDGPAGCRPDAETDAPKGRRFRALFGECACCATKRAAVGLSCGQVRCCVSAARLFVGFGVCLNGKNRMNRSPFVMNCEFFFLSLQGYR